MNSNHPVADVLAANYGFKAVADAVIRADMNPVLNHNEADAFIHAMIRANSLSAPMDCLIAVATSQLPGVGHPEHSYHLAAGRAVWQVDQAVRVAF